MSTTNIDNNSLAHTSWNCKYHIVFAQKYRRKVFFEEKSASDSLLVMTTYWERKSLAASICDLANILSE